MKLYYSKGACSLAVRIILHELNIAAEYDAVDLKTKKTQNGTDFSKISSKAVVPVLALDNNEILTENGVILQYLADLNKASHLLPAAGELQRYRVLEWMNYISTELHKNFSPLFKTTYPQEIKDNVIIPNIQARFNFIEQQLANTHYLTGDTFTLPDAYLFVMLLWAHPMKIDLTPWPHLVKYYEGLRHRNSIHQALMEEGLIK